MGRTRLKNSRLYGVVQVRLAIVEAPVRVVTVLPSSPRAYLSASMPFLGHYAAPTVEASEHAKRCTLPRKVLESTAFSELG